MPGDMDEADLDTKSVLSFCWRALREARCAQSLLSSTLYLQVVVFFCRHSSTEDLWALKVRCT